MVTDNFTHSTVNFLEWFKQQPGVTFHPSLQIDDLRSRHAGRGIVATSDIQGDVELFRIPRNTIIASENSSLSRKSPNFFSDLEDENAPKLVPASNGSGHHMSADNDHETDGDDDGDDFLDPWLRLIVTMIYEYQLGGESPWSPYLSVLPQSFDTPMFWTDGQLSELQASDLRGRIGKSSADHLFRTKLIPLLRAKSDLFFAEGSPQLGDDDIVTLAHRIGSAIMAYAFDLQKEDDEGEENEDGWTEDREGQMLGMVPMADMLNADAEFNAHLNHEADVLTMVSLRPIKAGEEVLNYYGPLPNSDLLRRYGYVSDKHDIHNVVELPWRFVLDAAKQHHSLSDEDIQRAMVKMDEDELEDSFVLEYASASPDQTGLLPHIDAEVVELPEPLTLQLRALLRYLRKTKDGFGANEVDFWTIAKMAIERRQNQYPSSIEGDEQVYQSLRRSDVVGEGILRKLMAVKVVLGEKRLLGQARTFVEGKLGSVDEEGPPKKRAKTS